MAKGKKKKMKVYLESTISGYATARPTSDERAAAMQTKTLQWVERWMKKCDCYVSKYDPILKEVHKIRQEISRRFGDDIEAYSRSLNRTYPGFRVARINPVRAFGAAT